MQKSKTKQKAKHSNARVTLSYSEIEPSVILPSSVQFATSFRFHGALSVGHMLDYKIKAKTQRVLGFSVRPRILVLSLSASNCDFWQVL